MDTTALTSMSVPPDRVRMVGLVMMTFPVTMIGLAMARFYGVRFDATVKMATPATAVKMM